VNTYLAPAKQQECLQSVTASTPTSWTERPCLTSFGRSWSDTRSRPICKKKVRTIKHEGRGQWDGRREGTNVWASRTVPNSTYTTAKARVIQTGAEGEEREKGREKREEKREERERREERGERTGERREERRGEEMRTRQGRWQSRGEYYTPASMAPLYKQ